MKINPRVPVDHTVVRRGSVYCEAQCGRGCTWEEFQAATRAAAALCTEMGEGWVPEVWDNLGWRYHIVRGVIEISPSIARGKIVGYFCIVQTTPQFVGHGETATASLEDAARQFNAVARDIFDSLAQARKALQKPVTTLPDGEPNGQQ